MIDNRRCPSAQWRSDDIQMPTPSGPRCGMRSRIRDTTSVPQQAFAGWKLPTIPHIRTITGSGLHEISRDRRQWNCHAQQIPMVYRVHLDVLDREIPFQRGKERALVAWKCTCVEGPEHSTGHRLLVTHRVEEDESSPHYARDFSHHQIERRVAEMVRDCDTHGIVDRLGPKRNAGRVTDHDC